MLETISSKRWNSQFQGMKLSVPNGETVGFK
nr:MAG TPA: hypothetical protein [Caudoviricetes sp.]DAT94780.1 MAG TPA: hypothetical protein [Caudoviricetes sp.]